MTTVRAPARFGYLELDGEKACRFREKPADGDGWIYGALFVLEPGVFELEGDTTTWERRPMKRLAADRQLASYRHGSFW